MKKSEINKKIREYMERKYRFEIIEDEYDLKAYEEALA